MNEPALSSFSAPALGAPDMSTDLGTRVPRELDNAAKAAIIVRLLMAEGEDIPIDSLPDELQIKLTAQMGQMGLIDKVTLDSVVEEFADALEGVGLSFPRGLAKALETLDGKISPQTAARLRKEAGVREAGDPWERLCALPVTDLSAMAQAESIEVAAVLLSKLDTKKAAELLTAMPGPLARRMTYAVSLTGKITPDAVDRIGLSLAAQLDQRPEFAFDNGPGERVGAILNQSPATTRDEMLTSLEEQDSEFAELVRKSIFIFEHITDRVRPGDAPTILREIESPVLITALAAATTEADRAAAEFLLSNISSRMADGLREEVSDRGKVRPQDGEIAMNAVVAVIRGLEQAGTISYMEPDPEDEG